MDLLTIGCYQTLNSLGHNEPEVLARWKCRALRFCFSDHLSGTPSKDAENEVIEAKGCHWAIVPSAYLPLPSTGYRHGAQCQSALLLRITITCLICKRTPVLIVDFVTEGREFGQWHMLGTAVLDLN